MNHPISRRPQSACLERCFWEHMSLSSPAPRPSLSGLGLGLLVTLCGQLDTRWQKRLEMEWHRPRKARWTITRMGQRSLGSGGWWPASPRARQDPRGKTCHGRNCWVLCRTPFLPMQISDGSTVKERAEMRVHSSSSGEGRYCFIQWRGKSSKSWNLTNVQM